MKHLIFVVLCSLLVGGCQKKEAPSSEKMDFVSLMGSDLPHWKHVQTKEDFENLAFFKGVYDRNIPLLGKGEGEKIPKVVHFIWLGPKSFPRESVVNVRSWMAHHPDWTFKFWTDRKRPLPHPDMQECMVRDFSFEKLGDFYAKSDNYGEQSDLLRIEILFKEGGVYVDHDVECMQGFGALHGAYDFYCGMDCPYPTSLSSSVLPTNNLVGAKKGHPLLEKMMFWLDERWEQIERDYPGRDRDSVINRVSHRTFFALGEAFKTFGNKEGNIDIALPTCYFNSPKIERALFAQHKYKGTWFENESNFERKARKRLMMLSKKANKLLLAVGVLAGLNLLGFVGIASLYVRLHKRREDRP
ncbi:MAG: Subversion of eukaryotic traffic protein A [Chlamydiae bacterium]|nr:Subversion of eukaryotic traffic protein A [Chlamydiota bacterium]